MGKGSKYYNGNKGKLWIDGVEYAECYKAEMKRTNNYETIPDPNGYGDIQVPLGYAIEGTITIRKQGNEAILLALKADKDGSSEYNIILKEENVSSGLFETIMYKDCTFDEFPLSQFESRTITEIELPVKARDYQVIV
jgi:hypothetical protein